MLEARPKIISVLTNYVKVYTKPIIVIAVLAIAFQGWRMYQKHTLNQQSQLAQENKKIKADIAVLTTKYEDLRKEKSVIEANNVKLHEDALYWQKKADSVVNPPKPLPPPQDDATLVADLKLAGVEFIPFKGTVFTTERTTLPIVWTWNKQALMVPTLEANVATFKTASEKWKADYYGEHAALGVANGMIETADARHKKESVDLIKNYDGQLKTKDKLILEDKVNGWIKVGITVPVVYGITRLTHK
jgi:hypothetical protein